MKQFSDWSKAVGQLDASLVDSPSARSAIRPRCNHRSFGIGLPSSMNLPGLSDFERRILKKECGAGRRAVRGHTTQAPQSASTAAEGSSPATPPTPPPEPPRRVGGTPPLGGAHERRGVVFALFEL